MKKSKFTPTPRPFKERATNFAQSMLFWKGRKKGIIHTRNIEWNDVREIFFPKDFNEKYSYLGYIHTEDSGPYSEVIRPLVLTMDKKAKPAWCPRWFLRFLEVFGNDKSIVRVRNRKLHNLHSELTKGYRFMDWKTKWSWYDLRISIHADKHLQRMADQIEDDFYKKGLAQEKKDHPEFFEEN
jgi:hypothetical protein